jgi:type I site-specific restriction endonuclease
VQQLNLPACDFKIKMDDEGKTVIYDDIRRKYVRLTPEEWVRQHLVQYLINDRGFPAAYTVIESGFKYAGTPVRADIIMYDRTGQPIMMVECKAPEIHLKETVFEQLARYNTIIDARYLLASNGKVHYCCEHRQKGGYVFLPEVPNFEV